MKYLYRLVIIISLFWHSDAFADSSKQDREFPSREAAKESLLPYWEGKIKESPSTKLFEKTKEDGVYNIETTVIPYKGRVKVLNIVVAPYRPVGTYDKQVIYGGVVQTELMDAPSDLAIAQSENLEKWQHLGWFDFDVKNGGWFSFNDWDAHFPLNERKPNGSCSRPIPNNREAREHSC